MNDDDSLDLGDSSFSNGLSGGEELDMAATAAAIAASLMYYEYKCIKCEDDFSCI